FISKVTFYKSSNRPYVLKKLTLLIGLHEKLAECVTLLNDLFSVEMFFILMLIFTYVLFGLFSKYMRNTLQLSYIGQLEEQKTWKFKI
ncbi:hypothetical protein Bhyg_07233, partial [Pseudolycoriella hygida]